MFWLLACSTLQVMASNCPTRAQLNWIANHEEVWVAEEHDYGPVNALQLCNDSLRSRNQDSEVDQASWQAPGAGTSLFVPFAFLTTVS